MTSVSSGSSPSSVAVGPSTSVSSGISPSSVAVGGLPGFPGLPVGLAGVPVGLPFPFVTWKSQLDQIKLVEIFT